MVLWESFKICSEVLYLSNRKPQIHVNGTDSEIETVPCGVCMEYRLGPLLFIIYGDELSELSNELFTVLFADDTEFLS